jgi:hypothetical protein
MIPDLSVPKTRLIHARLVFELNSTSYNTAKKAKVNNNSNDFVPFYIYFKYYVYPISNLL